jgi:hypothetical protein
MKEKRIYTIAKVVPISLLAIVPLLIYLCKFGSLELSKNFDTWVSFANYWSPFLTLATAVFTGIIAYQALIHNEKVESPLITFEMVNVSGKQFYIIKNAGKVPAVNCILLVQSTGSDKEWDQVINCYVIKPEEVKVISWIPYLKRARMHYQNFSQNNFTTTIKDQHNDFTIKDFESSCVRESYSDVSNQNLEDEILKSLSSSSENKDDYKMVIDLLLGKAKECNQIYSNQGGVYKYGHEVFSDCLNEIIISLQILDTLQKSIGTLYITERNNDMLKIFWIQLHVGIRKYVKDCYNNRMGNYPNTTHKKHMDTIHNMFSGFYENY